MLRLLWRFLDQPTVWKTAQLVAGRYTVRAYKRIAAELLQLTGREAVLDVGCGTGEYSQVLNCGKYIGIDFNPEYVAWARDAYRSDPRASFYSMSVAEVPQLNLSLDAALCVAVTHHLSNEEVSRLVNDVLAAVSVRFVIVDMVLPAIWKNPLSYLLIRIDRGRYGRTSKTLLQVLEETGAGIEAVSQTFGFPHSVMGISLRHRPARSIMER